MRVWPSDAARTGALALALCAVAPAAQAAGDAQRGASVFKAECTECHSAAQGRNKKGPSLFGIVGRPAAQLSDFSYSDVLKATGWTWDEATLRTYLSKPAKVANPGTKMKYDGLTDAQALDDLVAYLHGLR